MPQISLPALYAPKMLGDIVGLAHSSVLDWTFARRCRLAVSAAGEIMSKWDITALAQMLLLIP